MPEVTEQDLTLTNVVGLIGRAGGLLGELAPICGGAIPALLLSVVLAETARQESPTAYSFHREKLIRLTGLTRREQERALSELERRGLVRREAARHSWHSPTLSVNLLALVDRWRKAHPSL